MGPVELITVGLGQSAQSRLRASRRSAIRDYLCSVWLYPICGESREAQPRRTVPLSRRAFHATPRSLQCLSAHRHGLWGRTAQARSSFERMLDVDVALTMHRHAIWSRYDHARWAHRVLAQVLWLRGFVDRV